MSEPTLRLTFEDYIIRVAEYLGTASYGSTGLLAAAIPTDVHDLDLVKRLCNDGWRKFVNANPIWNWINPIISLTLDPDGTTNRTVPLDSGISAEEQIPRAARYFLPDGFYGQLVTNFTYPPAGPRIEIEQTTEEHIRQLFAGAATTTGDPYLSAVRPLADQGVPVEFRARWECIVFPTPDSTHTLTARARIYPNRLIDLKSRHNAGLQNDEAVLASMLATAELQRENAPGAQAAAFGTALANAIAMDQKTAPRSLGYNADRSDEGNRLWPGHPYYTGVDTYNSQALTF